MTGFKFSAGLTIFFILIILTTTVFAGGRTDTITTSSGDLEITCLGHGSLMFGYGGQTIYIDPWSKVTDYSKLPKADLIILTHHHSDHLDLGAINKVRKDGTLLVMTGKCQEEVGDQIKNPVIMTNGEVKNIGGLKIEAVPAYNLVHKRDNGQPFHPKGEGNGYVITFGDKRVYVAGDTENTPEMKALQNIDVAFLPMNLPYTMDSAMAADAAKAFRPKILYPYHTGFKDDQVVGFMELMKGIKDVEIRTDH